MGEVGFRDSLMPLSSATRAAHGAVYPQAAVDTSRLLSIAHVMAALIPMYSHDPNSGDQPRRLTNQELLQGVFRYRSHELHFMDGRAVIPHIAVRNADLPEVIALLRDGRSLTGSTSRTRTESPTQSAS